MAGALVLGCERDRARTRDALESEADAPSDAVEPRRAVVGQPAPRFVLTDTEGREVSLSQFQGRPVVLEWFNPECPFVRAAHERGSLRAPADIAQKFDAVWLAINSGAPGKQGHGVAKNRAGKARFDMAYPVLLDETGVVGRAYGAAHTPHLFVINGKGTLIYSGAVDNSPDAEGQATAGEELVHYVSRALAESAAGKPVSIPETKAYGCSVKYGG